jgi:hypothetical protein
MQTSSPKKHATVTTIRNIATTNQTVMTALSYQWTQSLLENHLCTHLFQKQKLEKEYINSQGKKHITEHSSKMAKK